MALFLQALIFSSIITIGLSTLPDLPPWAGDLFAIEEGLVVAVFSTEFLLRAICSPRLRVYLFSFWGVIDLLAILPFYLSLGVDLRALRVLWVLRLLRLLKMLRYVAAADRIRAAIVSVMEELMVFGVAAFFLIYICAIMIYYFEHDAQPQAFASVFHAMWWAAITLTTVGYGDVYPITAGGRIFTVVMLLFALGIIAVPTGLIASALSTARKRTDDAEK
ncbi:ion transporter [Mesorhizobium sp. IMUNJ 23232]|uniref:ion transporter n=1 Tax=Mesorhizobium sp. IMUNJ 23232 TaxID=3376064 RepID=UPI0037AF7433